MLCDLTSDPATSRHPRLPPERRIATKSVSTIKRHLHRHTWVCAARSNSCLYCTHYSLRHAWTRHPHTSTPRCYAEEYGYTLLVRCNIFHAGYCWRLFRGCYDTLLHIQGTTTLWLYRNDCVDVYIYIYIYMRRLMCVYLFGGLSIWRFVWIYIRLHRNKKQRTWRLSNSDSLTVVDMDPCHKPGRDIEPVTLSVNQIRFLNSGPDPHSSFQYIQD